MMKTKCYQNSRNSVWQHLTRILCVLGLSVLSHFAYAAGDDIALQGIKSTSVSDGQVEMILQFDHAMKGDLKAFMTQDPNMLVVDFEDTHAALSPKAAPINLGPVSDYQVVEAGGRTRLMVSLSNKVDYQTSVVGDTVVLNFTYEDTAPSVYEVKGFKPLLTGGDLSTQALYELKGVDFKRNQSDGGQVIFNIPHASMAVDIEVIAGDIIVHFREGVAPEWLRRRFDVTDFGTPVNSIDVVQTEVGYDAIIRTTGNFKHLAYQIDNQFIVDVNPVITITAEEQILKQYQGKRLSLNFQDIKVRAVLQVIADFTGINIVASDSVRGSVTLRLTDVPWDEALDIILRTQGLAKRQVGNILMVAPSKALAAQEQQSLQALQAVAALEPLRSELIQINYAEASNIAALLKNDGNSLLSERGSVSVEERTNTIWVQDTLVKLIEVRNLLKKLDRPVKQVLIEARIVRVNKDFERNYGVRFGMTSPDHLSGTFSGANQITSGIKPADVIPPTDRLNFNLPANAINGFSPSSIGVALAYLGKDLLLDLELSALEKEGGGEIISSPRLITSNKHPAYIEEGTEIPYQEATSSGATSVEFKKAVLSLHVTPQITPDGNVILSLKINQDSVNSDIMSEVPAIDTRQIETQVLIKNGETVVLGGIYEQTRREQVYRVPFIGTLPLIGALFRHTETRNDRTELLIFLTPKIIHNVFDDA